MKGPLAELVRAEVRELAIYEVPALAVRAKLDANESPFPLPPPIAEELGRVLAAVPLHRYPDGGCGALRALLASDLGVGEGQLALGNGSDELITMLAQAFGHPRPGRLRATVLYPAPAFVMYEISSRACGFETVPVSLRSADFSLDEEALEDAIRRVEPNLIYLARPNNPTGTMPRRAFLERLLERPSQIVVCDEAYVDYAGESALDLLPANENLVILRTLSKIGLAGLRLGFLVGSEAIVRELGRV